MSAVSVYTTFRIAFEGCLASTVQPARYGTAPTDTTARTECAAWAERFWNRKALSPELDACVQVTVLRLRRTLSSADFLTF